MYACARAGAPVKSFSFYIHYVHFFTTLCVSGGCLVNIAVNIVNIVNIEWPHPQPLPRREGSPCGGTAIEEYWYWREYCLVLSGMLLSACPNGWDDLSQRVGRFVPMGGTITKYIVLCFLRYYFIPHSAAFSGWLLPLFGGGVRGGVPSTFPSEEG